jgi:hypothetical protein
MVTLGDDDDVFNGSNTQLTVSANQTVSVNGNDNTVNAASGATMTVLGISNTILGSGDTMTVGDDDGQGANVVSGFNDQINVLSYAHIVVTGGDNTIQQTLGFITLGGMEGGADYLTGTDSTYLEANVLANSTVYLNGGVVAFTLGTECLVNTTGDNTSFVGSDDRILINGAYVGGDSIDGDNNRVILGALSLLDLTGNNNFVRMSAGSAMNVIGTGERLAGVGLSLAVAAGGDFWVGGNGVSGTPDLVSASDCTIRVGADSNVAMSGDDDLLAVRVNANFAFEGTGLLAHAGRNATVMVTSNGVRGAVDTVTGAYLNVIVNSSTNAKLDTFGANVQLGNDTALALDRADNTIAAGNSDTISILWGDSNEVTPGLGNVISDGGFGTIFKVDNGIGATTINDFAADPGGIIELLSGIGGFATAGEAYAALINDGAGGVKLALNVYGSIDFAGTSASQLSAANFKIG